MPLFEELRCHWLDCNIFVEAKNGPYAFDIAPGFWNWLEGLSLNGTVRSSIHVYTELQNGSDQLSRWTRTLKKSSGLFVTPSRSVQKRCGEIAAFVQKHYGAPQAASFLAGADPWIVAHALDDGGIVVTQETRVPSTSRQVKIPNVCDEFRVEHLGAYDAFRKLGLRLG